MKSPHLDYFPFVVVGPVGGRHTSIQQEEALLSSGKNRNRDAHVGSSC